MVSKNHDRRTRRTALRTLGAGSLVLITGVSAGAAGDEPEADTTRNDGADTDPEEGWAWESDDEGDADPDEGWAWSPTSRE